MTDANERFSSIISDETIRKFLFKYFQLLRQLCASSSHQHVVPSRVL